MASKHTQLEEYDMSFAMTEVAIYIVLSMNYTVVCNANYRNIVLYMCLQSKITDLLLLPFWIKIILQKLTTFSFFTKSS